MASTTSGLNLFRLWRDNPAMRSTLEHALCNGNEAAANQEGRDAAKLAWGLVKAHPEYAPQRAIQQADIDSAARGLNLFNLHMSEVAAIKTAHLTSELSFMFASKAIVQACEQEQIRRAR